MADRYNVLKDLFRRRESGVAAGLMEGWKEGEAAKRAREAHRMNMRMAELNIGEKERGIVEHEADRPIQVRQKEASAKLAEINAALAGLKKDAYDPEFQKSIEQMEAQAKKLQAEASMIRAQKEGAGGGGTMAEGKMPLDDWYDTYKQALYAAENETGIRLSNPDFFAKLEGDTSKLRLLAAQRNTEVRRIITPRFKSYAKKMEAIHGKGALERFGVDPQIFIEAGVSPEEVQKFYSQKMTFSSGPSADDVERALTLAVQNAEGILNMNPQTIEEARSLAKQWYTQATAKGIQVPFTVEDLQLIVEDGFNRKKEAGHVTSGQAETPKPEKLPGAPEEKKPEVEQANVQAAEEAATAKAEAEAQTKKEIAQTSEEVYESAKISSLQTQAYEHYKARFDNDDAMRKFHINIGDLQLVKREIIDWVKDYYQKYAERLKLTENDYQKIADHIFNAIFPGAGYSPVSITR